MATAHLNIVNKKKTPESLFSLKKRIWKVFFDEKQANKFINNHYIDFIYNSNIQSNRDKSPKKNFSADIVSPPTTNENCG